MVLRPLEVRHPHVVPRRRPRAHLLLHPGARRGIGEIPPQRAEPAVERPLRDHDVQAGRAVGVGIAVEGDIEPAPARVLHQGQHLRRAGGRRRPLVEVRDVRGDAGPAPDLERLAEGVEEAIAQAVADVRVVDPAEPARLLGEPHELVGVRVAAGRVVEPGRHAPGPFLHRRPEERALVRKLGRPRGTIPPAHGADPERRVPDEVHDVDRHPVREEVEVLLDRRPPAGQGRAAVEARVDLDERLEILVGRERRIGAAVDPDDLGRDALPDLGLVPGLGQDDQAGVRVHVDEARADDPPRGVERAVGLDPVEGAPEEAQPLALDPDRSVVARVARAIDDEAARDQDVEHAGPSGRQSITGSRRTAAARAATAGSSTGAGATPTRAGPPDRARR